MRHYTIASFVVGILIAAVASAEEQHQRGIQRGGQEFHRAVPPVNTTRQPAIQRGQEFHQVAPQVRSMQQSVKPHVQEFHQNVTPRVQERRAPVVTRTPEIQRGPIQQSQKIIQYQSNRYPQVTQERERIRTHHRHDRDRYNTKYYNNGYWGGATIYPYYGYPYLSAPYPAYPNRYFVCYEVDQSDEDSIHISCPYGTGWYSTSPAYDTYQYRSAYRPEYVCPEYGASQFVEFNTSYEARNWSNENCDQWIDNSGDDY